MAKVPINEQRAQRLEERARQLKIIAAMIRRGVSKTKGKILFKERMKLDNIKVNLLVSDLIEKYQEHGYGGLFHERAVWNSIVETVTIDEKKLATMASREAKKEEAPNPISPAFIRACNGLKPNAPTEEEIAWVESHPKVREAFMRQGEKDPAPISLAAPDISRPPNGKCPSQAAVTKLLFAIRNPDKWVGKMVDEQKKHSVSKQGVEEKEDLAPDASLDQLRDSLRQRMNG